MESILHKIGLVEAFVGPVTEESLGATLTERVNAALQAGIIEASDHKVKAHHEVQVLIDYAKLAGLGEAGFRKDPLEAAYWQGVQDMAKVAISLASIEGRKDVKQTILRKPDDETGGGFDWGEVSEDLQPIVEGKSPIEVVQSLVEDRDAHKAGATRREEQVIEGLMANEDFVKSFSEKHGFIPAFKDDKSFDEFAKSRIGEDTEYALPEIDNVSQAALGAWQKSARAAGVSPSQFAEFVKSAHGDMQEAAKAEAEKAYGELKDEMGDDFSEAEIAANKFLTAIGDDADGVLAVMANMAPELQKGMFKTLAMLGGKVGTAERSGDGSGTTSTSVSGDPEGDWAEARKMLAEANNEFEKMTPAQREQYNLAFDAVTKFRNLNKLAVDTMTKLSKENK